jgi:predicted ribonuclease YlaK
MGVFADDFKDDQAPILDEQYKGRRDVYISPADLDKYFNKGNIDLNDIEIYDDKGILKEIHKKYPIDQGHQKYKGR